MWVCGRMSVWVYECVCGGGMSVWVYECVCGVCGWVYECVGKWLIHKITALIQY